MKKEEGFKQKYSMNFTCDNCFKGFIEFFNFGERAFQGKCPNCGNFPHRENRYRDSSTLITEEHKNIL